MTGQKYADLVFEGGGVKGIALVGAYSVIEERGYAVRRVAGTSAGSIVGALVAAGMSAEEMREEMRTLDYSSFQDEGLLDRVPLVGKPLSLLFERGIYEGRYAHTWLQGLLKRRDVTTFADLPYDDPDFPLEDENQRFSLVVMVSDVSRGCLRRLPWDYRRYNCAPGEQAVADAVRASMSIPFFFEPVLLRDRETGKDSTLLDGGMLSNFPVDVFDARGREPRWPTLGLKLSAKAKSAEGTICDVHGPVSLATAMVKTMSSFYDRLHIDQPSVQDRTIFIDTGKIQAIDFDLTREQSDWLFEQGRAAAAKFFDGGDGQPGWDWDAYKAKYRRADDSEQPLGAHDR
jgi:NTE family protein